MAIGTIRRTLNSGIVNIGGTSSVTYIYNGQTIVERIKQGANCADKVVTITGATFLGWTTDNTNPTPMSNIPSKGKPLTLYAIWAKSVSINLGDSLMKHSTRTYQTVVTTQNAFNVRIYGTISAYTDDENDDRTTNTVYINSRYIGECSAHTGSASKSIDSGNIGTFAGVTVKFTIAPHGNADKGDGRFIGTCTLNGIG